MHVDFEAYTAEVTRLKSDRRDFTPSDVVNATAVMLKLCAVGNFLDHYKRRFFYETKPGPEKLNPGDNAAAHLYSKFGIDDKAHHDSHAVRFQLNATSVANDAAKQAGSADLVHALLGIGTEVAELYENFLTRTTTYNRFDIDVNNAIEECGDLIWYIGLLLKTLSVPLNHVLDTNIAKLRKRYPTGSATTGSGGARDTTAEQQAMEQAGVKTARAIEIEEACDEIKRMLVEKDRAYGASVSDPLRVFNKKADPVDLINVRLDDKLSRLMRGEAAGEDVELDIIGYLILKRVEMNRKAASA